MKSGDKENAMTVSLSKRLFEGDATTASLTSPTPASKRMRMLAPLAEHVGAASQIKAGAACVGALQQQHHSSARKRRHDTSTEHSSGVASPSNSGKRGKRGDGRPSTAAASPNTAKSALEALLTCEGLEKDADLEAEVAYITARQSTAGRTSAAGAGDNNDAAGPSSSGAAATNAEQRTPTAASAARLGNSGNSLLDAARSSREKRRDQDQNPRARRASEGARSSRDQANLASPETDAEALPATDLFGAAAAAGVDPQPDSPRPVTLDLIGDKEWDRLFAVLTLSDSASARHSSSSGATSSAAADGQAGAAASADDRSVGIRSHRLSRAVGTAATAPSAAGTAVQEAPGTPVRRQEGGSGSGGNPAELTPSRRSSFLAGEWQRVQQRRLNTPPRAAAGAGNSTACAPYVPDCDMGM